MSNSTATTSDSLEKAIAAWNLRVEAAFPEIGKTLCRSREDLASLDLLLAQHRKQRSFALARDNMSSEAEQEAVETMHVLLESLADFHVEMETLRAQIRRTAVAAEHLGHGLQGLDPAAGRPIVMVSAQESLQQGQQPEAMALVQTQRLVKQLREENSRLRKAASTTETVTGIRATSDRTPISLSKDEAHAEIAALRSEVELLREVAADDAAMQMLSGDLQGRIRDQAFDEAGKRRPMGRILVNAGIINESQLDAALREQRSAWNRHLGAILVDLGYADEDRIAQAIAAQTRLPFLYLDDEQIDASALRMVSGTLAHHHSSIPLRIEGRELVVAMANPLDLVALEDLRLASNLDIEPVVASAKEIRAKLRTHYGA